ncbi:ArdC family protein [Butyrivibrio sp. INlla14]|uniref:ArdC family protein n=1 Tax=Butyrivibrio sp. INlla14 TaxID=1520808 RepID=UPI0008768EF3|nr:ArdC family protein [Butyrivibrio sp. INlla14]SCY11096.1 hypothetical protein SAMN02910371_01103 [Butyrivibrio sp. INlla14]
MVKNPKYDPKEAAENRKAELKDITEKLEQGVKDVFESDNYKKLLDTMAKFPRYSINNNILIMLQKPDASLVQSYTGWKKMGRFVKKGEKGIRILAPAPYKIEKEQDKLDGNGKAILDKDGEAVKEKIEINLTAFKPCSTFDISQTEGEPIPTIGISELSGSVDGYETLFEALKQVSPVPVGFEDIKSGAKGYFHLEDNRIAINKGMSQVQNVKTLIHEMTHAMLDNKDAQAALDQKSTKNEKEATAESVAYTVCKHYGIDTSDYSFGYVATWSKGKELPELKACLNKIRDTASKIITSVDEKVEELTAGKAVQTQANEKDAATKEPAAEEIVADRPGYIKLTEPYRLEPDSSDKPIKLHKSSVVGKIKKLKDDITKASDNATNKNVKTEEFCH